MSRAPSSSQFGIEVALGVTAAEVAGASPVLTFQGLGLVESVRIGVSDSLLSAHTTHTTVENSDYKYSGRHTRPRRRECANYIHPIYAGGGLFPHIVKENDLKLEVIGVL